jgi:hypothetical protein
MSWQERYDAWKAAYEATPERDADFTTLSGIPLEPLYGPHNVTIDAERIGYPGQYPYTRGVYPSMYRTRPWTIRQFAGFADPDETNRRFHDLVRGGQHGLSVAFDMPTLMGLDSDDPLAEGEVGHCGVAIDSVHDMDRVFHDLPLGELTTSMTINAPAVTLVLHVRGRGGEAGLVARRPRRDAADRHLQGVHRAEGVAVPAGAAPAPDRRPDRVLHRAHPALPPDLDLRLPHPRGRLDGRAGARVHPRRRLRLRGARHGPGAAPRPVRAAVQLLLRRPHRLLRGDREVPRRSAHLGPLAPGALRRDRGEGAADAVPHPDRRGVAHRPAARQQHRAHRDRGAGRRPRRDAVAAHQRPRRGARAAVRPRRQVALRTQLVSRRRPASPT